MKKRFSVRVAILTALLSLPFLLYAQGVATTLTTGVRDFSGVVDVITNTLVKSIATLFLSLAVLAFFYGIVLYIWGMREGSGENVNKARQIMGWGLLALFVMFSVYGIIKLAQGFFFKPEDANVITIPKINFGS